MAQQYGMQQNMNQSEQYVNKITVRIIVDNQYGSQQNMSNQQQLNGHGMNNNWVNNLQFGG